MVDRLVIGTPKRKRRAKSNSQDFFPYYAGFSESFAEEIIKSADLPGQAVIFDPWNGSGTTTNTAAKLGFRSVGIDLNPVMVLVARARNLTKADDRLLLSWSSSLLKDLNKLKRKPVIDDPLLQWFTYETAALLRNLERRISRKAGDMGIERGFNKASSVAASMYVALFTIAKYLTKSFNTSNPTWLKTAEDSTSRIEVSAEVLCSAFQSHIDEMVRAASHLTKLSAKLVPKITIGNSINYKTKEFADFILTSPPYCTRIDYTSATRMELAIIAPLLEKSKADLSREMIGSIRVPVVEITAKKTWGATCLRFLAALNAHASKASRGYYYKTHLDYFNKMSISINNISQCLKPSGVAVFVVQNSHYKEIHNDVPSILSEMAKFSGMSVIDRTDFHQKNSIGKINSRSKKYLKSTGTFESVIVFKKTDKREKQ